MKKDSPRPGRSPTTSSSLIIVVLNRCFQCMAKPELTRQNHRVQRPSLIRRCLTNGISRTLKHAWNFKGCTLIFYPWESIYDQAEDVSAARPATGFPAR